MQFTDSTEVMDQDSVSSVFNVTASSFIEDVIENSKSVPILIDFWASWCGPCKSLTPILESLVGEYNGAFLLGKVNIDEEQEIAAQFQVQSVPMVFLVSNGQVIDGFLGAQPKGVIQEFLAKHNIEPNGQNDILQADGQATQSSKPDGSADYLLSQAQTQLLQGEIEQAKQTLEEYENKNAPRYKTLHAEIELALLRAQCEHSDSELREAVANNSNDWNAHYYLCIQNYSDGEIESALDGLLEMVKMARSFNDDAGRRTMILIFDALGSNHELVVKYRSLLASALH